MSINLANVPYSVTFNPQDLTADDTQLFFRFPAEGRVLAVYAVNTATESTATNTLAVTIAQKGTTGTDANTTIAAFAAASGWTADVPRTGSLTAANQDVASGVWLAAFFDETGTITMDDMVIQVDYMLATGATT